LNELNIGKKEKPPTKTTTHLFFPYFTRENSLKNPPQKPDKLKKNQYYEFFILSLDRAKLYHKLFSQ
jgi:hypothetical protein